MHYGLNGIYIPGLHEHVYMVAHDHIGMKYIPLTVEIIQHLLKNISSRADS